jgi:hypothetical protein
VSRGLEHAKRHESIVAGDEVRGRDTPDVEQLEDRVEVLPETGMPGVSGNTFSRREGRPVFAVLVKKPQTALDVLSGEAFEQATDEISPGSHGKVSPTRWSMLDSKRRPPCSCCFRGNSLEPRTS